MLGELQTWEVLGAPVFVVEGSTRPLADRSCSTGVCSRQPPANDAEWLAFDLARRTWPAASTLLLANVPRCKLANLIPESRWTEVPRENTADELCVVG